MNDEIANLIIAQLLFLESEDPDKDINFYINSPGGVVTAGLAVYDTMQYIKPDITTVCIGQAASIGEDVGIRGDQRGSCWEGIKEAKWGGQGDLDGEIIQRNHIGDVELHQARDIAIQANEILRMKDTLNNILVRHTGKNLDQIQSDTDRDFFMTGEEAKAYGLIDHVIVNRDDFDKIEKAEK